MSQNKQIGADNTAQSDQVEDGLMSPVDVLLLLAELVKPPEREKASESD